MCFELSDWAIIKGLTHFCEVVNYRQGKFDFECAPMFIMGYVIIVCIFLSPSLIFFVLGDTRFFLNILVSLSLVVIVIYQAISAMCAITKFVLIVRTLAMRLTTVQRRPCAIFVKKMVTLAAIALTPGLHPSSMASLRMRLHPSWWMTMVMMAQSLVNPVRHTQMIPSDGLMSQISLTPMLTL